MTDEITPEEEPQTIWLNAFSCIRPTDEFLIEVGRSILRATPTTGTTTIRVART